MRYVRLDDSQRSPFALRSLKEKSLLICAWTPVVVVSILHGNHHNICVTYQIIVCNGTNAIRLANTYSGMGRWTSPVSDRRVHFYRDTNYTDNYIQRNLDCLANELDMCRRSISRDAPPTKMCNDRSP